MELLKDYRGQNKSMIIYRRLVVENHEIGRSWDFASGTFHHRSIGYRFYVVFVWARSRDIYNFRHMLSSLSTKCTHASVIKPKWVFCLPQWRFPHQPSGTIGFAASRPPAHFARTNTSPKYELYIINTSVL